MRSSSLVSSASWLLCFVGCADQAGHFVDLADGAYLRGEQVVTFDVTNLQKSKQRSYFQFQNATFTQYAPGRTFMLGLRMKF